MPSRSVFWKELPRNFGWTNLSSRRAALSKRPKVRMVSTSADYSAAAKKDELLDMIQHGAEKIINNTGR
jgi:hypothetical protein